MVKNRDYRIDNVRAIAMICIILAHCVAPSSINNLRSFDVITLVFLSGLVFNVNRTYDFNTYESSMKRRFIRLFLPTSIYIVLMSFFQFIIYKVAGRSELLNVKTIINSFLLCENSIGYVWIMKVYFVNFLMSPLFVILIKKIKHIWQYLILISVWFFVYICCLNFYGVNAEHSYIAWILIHEWFLCCMFYLLIGLDSIFYKMNDIWRKYGILFWGIVFIETCFIYKNGFYFSPAIDKRPPGIQYLTYGMLITYLLMKLIPNKESRLFTYISVNSMDIYYCHTFVVFMMSCIQSILKINGNYFWAVQFVIAFFGSLLICNCLNIVKKKIASNK